ncbi:ABC transporter substrate-binding protein [Acutalibacter caecimuris]|uniref:ABC transporter substrate-binding protein n=1 Tax=Acutalibacter caecimuris TaxID=3093657 RepID=UPI002AC99950|nr:ABC transporter substrate-binding protein [Acutalibacter sp. M00118]
MKKFLAMLLVFSLLLACAACGGDGSSSQQSTSSADSSTAGTSSEDAPVESNADVEDGDYPVLRFNMNTATGDPRSKTSEVMDAINEILREKAHAEIEPVWVTFADMQTQLNLLLTGGDDSLDFFSSFWYQPLGILVSNGQVAELDSLLEEYGQETKELFGDYEAVLDCGRVGGKLYGIPSYTAWTAPNIYFSQKADADSANIDWSKVTDLDSATEAMLAMKKANPDHYYIPGSTEPYWIPKGIDYLGDQNYLGVLLDPEKSTTIENYYESDYFLNIMENVKIWQQNGIISPDPMSCNSATLASMQNGLVSGTTGYSWDAAEFCHQANVSGVYGGDLVGAEISPSYITTGNVTTYLWHITPFCKEPEAAMRVLNLLYTDPEVATIFSYGVEGVTYQLDENGAAAYLDGENGQTSGWTGGQSFVVPNGTIVPLWFDQSPDANERIYESNKNAKRSIALGFTCDMEPVADQVAACANVIAQYYTPLMNGVVDIDEVVPVFQKALHDAGIDEIIKCKQEQLDDWLAAQG